MCVSCTNQTSERHDIADRILTRFNYSDSKLVPILQTLQDKFGYLPRDLMAYVASALRLPPARVYGVATFYAHFSLHPKGKHVLKLCDGTACHVKASIPILHALEAHLNLSTDQTTTDDGLFTVEKVSCLGACGLAPVLVIDEQVHGQVTPEMAVQFVEDIKEQEALTEEVCA